MERNDRPWYAYDDCDGIAELREHLGPDGSGCYVTPDCGRQLIRALDGAEAEVDRLRAALERWRDYPCTMPCPNTQGGRRGGLCRACATRHALDTAPTVVTSERP